MEVFAAMPNALAILNARLVHAKLRRCLIVALVCAIYGSGSRGEAPSASNPELASVAEMIEARTDVWGDAAMSAPNGATYEFFVDLLPPLRWVNTDFRHYPIVLSAPLSPQKSRLVSNGSAVNARANMPPMWYEQGTPVTFHVGRSSEMFGGEFERLNEPTYLDGYLPVVAMGYEHEGLVYEEEAFAPVDAELAANGVAMIRFKISSKKGSSRESKRGHVEARLESTTSLRVENGRVLNDNEQCIVAFGPGWKWEAGRNALAADVDAQTSAGLVVFTKPAATASLNVTKESYDQQRQKCIESWNEVLDESIQLQTPESIVNDAWRAALIGNFMIAISDRPNYSAQNAYAKLYEGECGDTLRSFLLFGHEKLATSMLRPMLKFDRFDTRFHVAGQKLQLLAHFYWVTRDADTVRALEPLWRPSVELILTSREVESGLLPKDRYAGDIQEKVYSLNSNSNCWRGVRDLAAVLAEMGNVKEAARLNEVANGYRRKILAAVARSERLEADPPFIPNALLADEPAHDPLTATRTGSYYDLMCPYIIGSEIFGQGSEREDWLISYLQQHGGIAMGMPRTQPAQGQFQDQPGVNPLYGLRYQLALLRRDDRERALVGFYGQLAQGMTRGTYIGGEGSRFVHGDELGRSFYLPPNSTSNAAWLIALRYLLVQDWDLDADAEPDMLRLLYGAPRGWLADGKSIRIERAPTAFGRVSCVVESKLNEGYVDVDYTPPPRPVEKVLLRTPLPEGWQVTSAKVDGKSAALSDDDAVDLSSHQKRVRIRLEVERTSGNK
jgi:hypothetical protein